MTILTRAYVKCDTCGKEEPYPSDNYTSRIIFDPNRISGKRKVADYCNECEAVQ